MKQYEVFELTYCAPAPAGSHVDVDVAAVFTCGDAETQVTGFYAGNGVYKVRFLPLQPGEYHYEVSGIVTDRGDVTCAPADPGRHGPVHADGTHFKYADGSWFYPFGTTVYALVHQDAALIQQTMQTLETAPFNKVRMCVFPKHYDYNHNKPPYYAFCKDEEGNWDPSHPCFDYWDHLEHYIRRLDQMGIQVDLIVFHPYDRWGFSRLPVQQAHIYLDYLTRRLSAFPNIWWSLANEYELLAAYEYADWEGFAAFIHSHDPAKHLLSNHNIAHFWDFSNPATSHICVQSSDIKAVSGMIHKYQKPMMVDECRYEGNIPLDWGNISGFEMAHRFWVVCTQGGYCTHGETILNEEGILWWARGGKLVGQSPARIAFLRQILESLPGPLTNGNPAITPEYIATARAHLSSGESANNPFMKILVQMTDPQLGSFLQDHQQLQGCVGNEAYLKYYERNCTSLGKLELDESCHYDVDVIDIWEMTRTTVLRDVTGKVDVPMPGKEGIAILATKRN